MQFTYFLLLAVLAVSSEAVMPLIRSRPSFDKQAREGFEKTSYYAAPATAAYIKYTEELRPLDIGSEIFIDAHFYGRGDIDLKCGGGLSCLPLVISIRPSENCIVFNSYLPSGSFDYEKRRYLFLEKNVAFKMPITIRENFYEITINDYYTKLFEHHIPYLVAEYLVIFGDITVNHVVVSEPPTEEEEQ